MCYKGKCFYCIPVENGCLVLAILSAIGTGLTLLASIIVGLLTAAGVIFVNQRSHSRTFLESQGVYEWSSRDAAAVEVVAYTAAFVAGVSSIIVGVSSLIAFIFSVLLCNGICNRRPGQVKAYFIYGVVITVLMVLASVVILAVDDDEPEIGIGSLFGCVIYSVFLVLVHQTYVKLRDAAMFKDHIRLVES